MPDPDLTQHQQAASTAVGALVGIAGSARAELAAAQRSLADERERAAFYEQESEETATKLAMAEERLRNAQGALQLMTERAANAESRATLAEAQRDAAMATNADVQQQLAAVQTQLAEAMAELDRLRDTTPDPEPPPVDPLADRLAWVKPAPEPPAPDSYARTVTLPAAGLTAEALMAATEGGDVDVVIEAGDATAQQPVNVPLGMVRVNAGKVRIRPDVPHAVRLVLANDPGNWVSLFYVRGNTVVVSGFRLGMDTATLGKEPRLFTPRGSRLIVHDNIADASVQSFLIAEFGTDTFVIANETNGIPSYFVHHGRASGPMVVFGNVVINHTGNIVRSHADDLWVVNNRLEELDPRKSIRLHDGSRKIVRGNDVVGGGIYVGPLEIDTGADQRTMDVLVEDNNGMGLTEMNVLAGTVNAIFRHNELHMAQNYPLRVHGPRNGRPAPWGIYVGQTTATGGAEFAKIDDGADVTFGPGNTFNGEPVVP